MYCYFVFFCRPWYVSAATYPKDLVIMIDKAHSMTEQFGTETRMFYAIKAVQSVIDTLNPNDHVSITRINVQNISLYTC